MTDSFPEDIREKAGDQFEIGCGCAYCDLGLSPEETDAGLLVHMHGHGVPGYSPCLREPRSPDTAQGTRA